MRTLLLITVLFGASACRVTLPSDVVPELPEGPVVLVKELNIPDRQPWYTHFAAHTFFEYRVDGRWWRLGIPTRTYDIGHWEIETDDAADDRRWDRQVRVVDVLTGSRAQAAIAVLLEPERFWTDGSYRAFPGPNSNTFAERVLRASPAFTTQLSPNAIGRDYALFHLGRTGSGSGIELETPILGAEIGIREGVQLHVLQFPIGVRFWPPAVLLPFLPALGP
tara:strand:+ start:3072 stop:3737 length:666 start_codon:yes stop_codon:yes gene_type:complete